MTEKIRIMNSFDRALIEKAGNDNGWEIILESTPERVVLSSARHMNTVSVTSEVDGQRWQLEFTGTVDSDELRRGLPDVLFPDDKIIPYNAELFGTILHRYAELAIALPDRLLTEYQAQLSENACSSEGLDGTETERLVKQRIDQNFYRNVLMNYCKEQCAVTDISMGELLRASHAKPWADCESDSERLNVYNGFLLSANLDALFESSLISFSEAGIVILSPQLDDWQCKVLGLSAGLALRWIDLKHLPFLKWHREHVFRKD